MTVDLKGDMTMRVLGVHLVGQNVYLLEAICDGDHVDWGCVTQPVEDTPRSNWQVAWDESEMEQEGHWAFFFHDLATSKPIETGSGPIPLPSPTPIPGHLAEIIYEPPC